MWQAFRWSSSVWTTVKAQRDKVASWGARMVANVIGVKKPPWMEMDQWWSVWHRTGHRWIEKCNMNVLTAIRERVLCWAGHVARMDYSEICAKALRCRGLQWWRWRQLRWKEVEKDKMGWSVPKNGSKSTVVSTEVSKICENAGGLAESVHLCLQGRLHLAQDRGQWRQFAKIGKIRPRRGHCEDTAASGVQAHLASWRQDFFWWLRMASKRGNGSDRRRLAVQVAQSETENGEGMREWSLTSSLHSSQSFKSWLLWRRCPHSTALDVAGLRRV